MLSEEYHAYIRSDAWAMKRTQYWATLKRRECQACGRNTNLHVHHMTYERFKSERVSDLIGLCETCHSAVHAYHHKKGGSLQSATMHVIGVIKGTPRQVTYIKAGHSPRTVKVPKKKQPSKKPKKKREMTADEIERQQRHNPTWGVKTGTRPEDRNRKPEPVIQTQPNKHGFVPRHLRGAQRAGGAVMTATPWSRDTWRP